MSHLRRHHNNFVFPNKPIPVRQLHQVVNDPTLQAIRDVIYTNDVPSSFSGISNDEVSTLDIVKRIATMNTRPQKQYLNPTPLDGHEENIVTSHTENPHNDKINSNESYISTNKNNLEYAMRSSDITSYQQSDSSTSSIIYSDEYTNYVPSSNPHDNMSHRKELSYTNSSLDISRQPSYSDSLSNHHQDSYTDSNYNVSHDTRNSYTDSNENISQSTGYCHNSSSNIFPMCHFDPPIFKKKWWCAQSKNSSSSEELTPTTSRELSTSRISGPMNHKIKLWDNNLDSEISGLDEIVNESIESTEDDSETEKIVRRPYKMDTDVNDICFGKIKVVDNRDKKICYKNTFLGTRDEISQEEMDEIKNIPYGLVETQKTCRERNNKLQTVKTYCNDYAKYNSKNVSMRTSMAQKHLGDTIYTLYFKHNADYNDIYTKGLRHNRAGFVDIDEISKLIQALKTNNKKLLPNAGLLNPLAAWTCNVVGRNSATYNIKSGTINCEVMSNDIIELYSMSMCRDIPFCSYDNHNIISECVKYLPHIKNSMSIDTIYRGYNLKNLGTPYISQFLYLSGGCAGIQKYPSFVEGKDHMLDWNETIRIQSNNQVKTIQDPQGGSRELCEQERNIPRYIVTGRDLATYCKDDLCRTWYNTCDILLNMGLNRGCADFGKYDIHTALAIVIRNSLSLVWYGKWNTFVLRPEAYGIEIERCFATGKNICDLRHSVLTHPIIQKIRRLQSNALLSQVYIEGSPLSPSTPSGYATVAGACVTVLKMFFQCDRKIDIYQPTIDGQTLKKTNKISTIQHELNTLAYNVGLGRCWAGINYRSDIEQGLHLGQMVAISCLREIVFGYNNSINVDIELINGDIVNIANDK